MKQKHVFLSICILIVILLLAACQTESELVTTTESTDTVTDIVVTQPTLELAMTLPPLPIPTEIAKTTSAPNPSPTLLATTDSETTTLPPLLTTPTVIAATLTPLSTLEGEELDVAVAELLKNPMNCDSPCWWGAIPGFTHFNEIKHAMFPYNFRVSEYEENGEVVYLLLETGYVEEQDNYEIGIVYNFSHSKLVGVTAYSPSISQFLDEFGQPDEIWLSTISFERGDLPVWLNLVYLQEGMAVGYMVDGDIRDGVVTGCFVDKETGRLRLLVPDTATSYRDFTPIFELDRRYLSLEESTSLTIDDFMQQFSDPSQPQCIETPAELWE